MPASVIIYGAGGHAKVIADILKSEHKKVLGIVDDDPEKSGQRLLEYQITKYD